MNKYLFGIMILLISFFLSPVGQAGADFSEPSGELSYEQVLALVLDHNPDLIAASKQIEIWKAKRKQADLLLNPEVELEVSEFGGSDLRRGTKTAELSAILSQEFEWGGKRSHRVRVSELHGAVAYWNFESFTQDVIATAVQAFLQVASIQEKLALFYNIVTLGEEMLAIVTAKVEAGQVSPLEQVKAEVNLAQSILDQRRTSLELEAARRKLATTWGSEKPVFSSVIWDLYDISPVPGRAHLDNRLSQNPDLAGKSAEIDLSSERISLERSQRLPNITFSGGIHYFKENEENAFSLGVAFPVPFTNRNQGHILAAHLEKAKAKSEQKAAALKIKAAFTEVYQLLVLVCDEVTTLRETVLPGAQTAYTAAQEGYKSGKFEYLDILDAYRTYFEVKHHYLEALTEYHLLKLEINRLTGSLTGKRNPNRPVR